MKQLQKTWRWLLTTYNTWKKKQNCHETRMQKVRKKQGHKMQIENVRCKWNANIEDAKGDGVWKK